MEAVYFFEDKAGKDVVKALKEDQFKHIGYIIRECNLLGSERKGYFLYLNANSEEIDRAERKLEGLGLEKILGSEMKAVADTIRTGRVG
ncbi:hypothetical protein ANME2D_00771 [Candidatus Methanoperedens nitroreducens]|uniref:Uncharacterized protein n=1 Tax=Candidatus Methanoperedens nitratireducens TaxID=1392998 RepID=A0A062VB06_9EURY|nr:hypothetical protein [Candidatus Methanoperedens nitroreducens]KCZ73698.1 hypothetical protein ANME2D_00771 [Candidatus Methanoperedens nitroreducens]MDJ1422343.1 hypothetical protein [Candidatus Methanoperedens sp.]